jgi:hypothetical protein
MWEWILLLLVLIFFGGGALGWFPKFGAYLKPEIEFRTELGGGIYFGNIGPLMGGGTVGQQSVNQVAQSNGITPIPNYPSTGGPEIFTVRYSPEPVMGPEESLEHYLSRI